MRKDQMLMALCLGYIGGVFTGSFLMVAGWLVLLLGALAAAVPAVFFRKNILFVVLGGAVFVYGIFSVTQSSERFSGRNIKSGAVSGVARVVNDPEEKKFYRQAVLRMVSCVSEYCPQEKILWQAPLYGEVAFGARVNFSCALALPENFDETFDYRMFLAKNGIGYICREAAHAQTLKEDFLARLGRWLFAPKRLFLAALNRSLPQPEAGLAEGLILGGDGNLPENLKQAFVNAGLSHIVAISGYNIALIAQGFVVAGIFIGLWRKQALWFAAFGVLWFVVLVGAQASSVRAGVMGLCAFTALFVGRLSNSLNLLLLAAALMLFWEPLLLRYDMGFQLSFLAALSIIIAAPFTQNLLAREFWGKIFAETALMTLAVELFVVPLIVYQFRVFSPVALLANVLILPFIPQAMLWSFLAGAAFLVWPGLHLLPSAAAYLFLRAMTFVAEQISALPGAQVKISITAPFLILWYVALFLLILLMKKLYWRKYYVENVQTKNIF